MSTMAKLKKAAESMGATVEEGGGGRFETWYVVAPEGKMWHPSGAVNMIVEWMPGCPDSQKAKREAIEDALSRMEWGLATDTN